MTFTPIITLSRCMTDPNIFGKVFAAPSFWTWRTVAKLIDGIPLSEKREVALYEACTGRKYALFNRLPVRRLYILAGRRAGKDRFMSAVAVWRAALLCNWKKYNSAGEQAVVILLGADRRQGNILSKYCRGLVSTPLIEPEVVRQVRDVIEFRNGSSLEIGTSDASLVRGRSAIAVLGSESCHWKTSEESHSSDEEVVGAALPSMAMCPDTGVLLLGSSVHRQRGLMYRKYRQCFGNEATDDIVWFATSRQMNSRLPESVVNAALAEDAPRARAEYLGKWREDLDDFIPADVVDAATDRGILERLPLPGVQYTAYCDSAGGTGNDAFTLAIGHKGSSYIIDVLREKKPRFVPAEVIAEWAPILKLYRISKIVSDKFAGGFHSSEWRAHGIEFEACERTTSENYLASLPVFLAGRVRLVDSPTLRHQLTSLERRAGDGGREKVDHPSHSGAHDDCATSVCGAIAQMSAGALRYDYTYSGFIENQQPSPSRPIIPEWARGFMDERTTLGMLPQDNSRSEHRAFLDHIAKNSK